MTNNPTEHGQRCRVEFLAPVRGWLPESLNRQRNRHWTENAEHAKEAQEAWGATLAGLTPENSRALASLRGLLVDPAAPVTLPTPESRPSAKDGAAARAPSVFA